MDAQVNALLDTNILIDYLNGVDAAREELGRYEEPQISVISWMEVLVGAQGEEEEREIRAFLGRFRVAGLVESVAEGAVELRRQHGLRLPDALIWATALDRGLLLVTRNTRDFPAGEPGIRVPYRI
jgi:hypothetical protein